VPLEDRERLYADLASAAASGWDFSSRWMARLETLDAPPLARTATTSVIPVDLNAILLRMEVNLAQFHADLGHRERSAHFNACAAARRRAITVILYEQYYWSC
jgi:alpha,alpha-trehalase